MCLGFQIPNLQAPNTQIPNRFRFQWVPYIGSLIPDIRIASLQIPVDILCRTTDRFQSTFYLGSPIPNIQIPILQTPKTRFRLQCILWQGFRIPDMQIQNIETLMDFLSRIPHSKYSNTISSDSESIQTRMDFLLRIPHSCKHRIFRYQMYSYSNGFSI